MAPLKTAAQICIKLRGRALGITPEACHLTALTDAVGTPLSLIPPERIAAARAFAHQITQQLAEIEDAA